ncbi:MAG: alpha/beta hydrolase [Clostridia bacterium]|nr:alpha/beta hydrolase [Clostridia bacterium]
MKRENFVSFDGKNISLAVWDEVEQPKGVVQIAHGMAEHVERYDEFARHLNGLGFIVVGDDHRAHGITDQDALGIAYGNLFEDTVKDLLAISADLKRKYDLPLILFGHSYGSFLSQRYAQNPHPATAIVLCGSALMRGAALNLGYFVANRKVKSGKKDDPALFLAKITFGAYGKKFEGGSSWLSTDMEQVRKYRHDGKSGFICSYGFYQSFFKGLKTVDKTKKALSKPVKLLIVSGGDDPVGDMGKSVKKLYEKFKKINDDTTLKLYDGMRHEILNEKNREEVRKYLGEFICSAL